MPGQAQMFEAEHFAEHMFKVIRFHLTRSFQSASKVPMLPFLLNCLLLYPKKLFYQCCDINHDCCNV